MAVTLDNLAETLAQILFAALIILVVLRMPFGTSRLLAEMLPSLPWLALAVATLAALMLGMCLS